ncbi:uncharacterized protein LOC115957126 [Quercus lobata]|uniref:uncharacterized protein LOC115957126 n=1 Tax=Quercus lobata TaxID=97700 RepID=UPI001248172D|nr:uncharacterized protein LOC115957126 [Quercus lobata]
MELLKDAFPMCERLPSSNYEAKKIVNDLGLHYEKINVCKDDCALYYKEYSEATQCPVCKLSRWQPNKGGKGKNKKVPWKVLRYFPLKSRLQQLFMSTKTAADMKWHHEKRVNDGVLRHLADCEAWKKFDQIHESFAMDPCNVRLGLATDGFNPFGNMSPKGPGNDIDVFLRPLIDELKELWEDGVCTYDASTNENFQMRAAVLWTIHDFPAYAVISGWSTKGNLACPCCHNETTHYRLRNGYKICYMGHCRFLALDHKWRNKKSQFNGKKERKTAPKRLSGDDVLKQIRPLKPIIFGKRQKKQFLEGHGKFHNWKKHSIFFELPYWRTLLLRHNLDVMHVEKNIFDSVIGTIMNIKDKTKDSLSTRLDLKEMGIRHTLHPIEVNGKIELPPACYTLSNDEKRAICLWLKNLKFPDGYSANLSRCVNIEERKISGMKTHDCHVFLERLLPLAVRDFLPKNVSDALTELSNFFKRIVF